MLFRDRCAIQILKYRKVVFTTPTSNIVYLEGRCSRTCEDGANNPSSMRYIPHTLALTWAAILSIPIDLAYVLSTLTCQTTSSGNFFLLSLDLYPHTSHLLSAFNSRYFSNSDTEDPHTCRPKDQTRRSSPSQEHKPNPVERDELDKLGLRKNGTGLS